MNRAALALLSAPAAQTCSLPGASCEIKQGVHLSPMGASGCRHPSLASWTAGDHGRLDSDALPVRPEGTALMPVPWPCLHIP